MTEQAINLKYLDQRRKVKGHISQANIRVRLVKHVERVEETINGDKELVEKPKGKNPLGRPTGRWEDNIKVALGNVRWGTRPIWFKLFVNGQLLRKQQ
jgi:hypothetical protein